MYRIKALNDSNDENSEDDSERVTKEAEVRIQRFERGQVGVTQFNFRPTTTILQCRLKFN